jgi:hypothetical protein
MERLKGDIKETKRSNRKLEIRVQTFEKKLELERMKEEQTTAMLHKAHEDVEKSKLVQENYSILVNQKNLFPLNISYLLIFID